MTSVRPPHRRAFVAGLAGIILGATGERAFAAEAQPKLVVFRDPSCGCCGAWAEHMRQAGFPVEVVETSQVNRVKARLGVPSELASCHTAEVGGYVVEGHVPASAVRRLIAERPQGRGLAVPGMPVGSPGMEVPNAVADAYDVILFGPAGQRRYARFKGAEELAA